MRIDTLEGRRLLSVTVNEAFPGFYEVTGDAANDVISISVSQANQTFTLDDVTYTDVAYVSVYGGAGDDTIGVVSADGEGSIGTSVVGGDGNDTITVNFDGAIWAGAGNDTLRLTDSFRGQAYGEGGDDKIYVGGNTVNPDVNGGDGNDLIDASANNYGVVLHGGAGDDVLYGSVHDDELYGDGGNDSFYGNGGNDVIYFQVYSPDGGQPGDPTSPGGTGPAPASSPTSSPTTTGDPTVASAPTSTTTQTTDSGTVTGTSGTSDVPTEAPPVETSTYSLVTSGDVTGVSTAGDSYTTYTASGTTTYSMGTGIAVAVTSGPTDTSASTYTVTYDSTTYVITVWRDSLHVVTKISMTQLTQV